MSRILSLPRSAAASKRPRLAISACLLGQEVRYNGGHARNAFLSRDLGRQVDWFPYCPELELGLGVPRPTIRLERAPDRQRPHLVEHPNPKGPSGRDLSEAMRELAARRVPELLGLGLDGLVVKKGSPSCGMKRVKVWAQEGPASKEGRGLFTEALMQADPLLPVEEEGRLHDPVLREHFIERVFAMRGLRLFLASDWGLADLVLFHTRHKLQLRSHDLTGYRALGRLVAGAKHRDRKELASEYRCLFAETLAHRPRVGPQVDVLQHLCGFFKRRLDAVVRAELQALIEDYRQGFVPLSVPLTLLRHHVRRLGLVYVAAQSYLEPYPKQLALRHDLRIPQGAGA